MPKTNIATLRPSQADKVGSVGKLFANVEARFVDDNPNDVRQGVERDACVGPNSVPLLHA
jgi:4-coumarate--CoA ligase